MQTSLSTYPKNAAPSLNFGSGSPAKPEEKLPLPAQDSVSIQFGQKDPELAERLKLAAEYTGNETFQNQTQRLLSTSTAELFALSGKTAGLSDKESAALGHRLNQAMMSKLAEDGVLPLMAEAMVKPAAENFSKEELETLVRSVQSKDFISLIDKIDEKLPQFIRDEIMPEMAGRSPEEFGKITGAKLNEFVNKESINHLTSHCGGDQAKAKTILDKSNALMEAVQENPAVKKAMMEVQKSIMKVL